MRSAVAWPMRMNCALTAPDFIALHASLHRVARVTIEAHTIVAITATLSMLITMVEYCFDRVGPLMCCSMAMLDVSDELMPPCGSMAILVGARLTNECGTPVTSFSSWCASFITRSLPSDACAQNAMSWPPRTVISSKFGITPPSRAIQPKSLPDVDIPAKSTAA